MNSRTRRFLLGSSLVLIVGLCTGLVAYYNGSLPIGRAESAPAEFAYVPADATAVAYADVRSIMTSQFRQKLREVLPTPDGQDELQAELGIDIERDIDTVVAGLMGGEPTVSGAVVLVRGRLNEANIEAIATRHGATVETYRGKRMIVHSGLPGTHEGVSIHGDAHNLQVEKSSGGVAFLEPGLVAIGDSGALKRAIDAAATNENVTRNAALMTYIGDVQSTGHAWIVGHFDAISKSADLPEQVKTHMPQVQWFAASAKVNGGLSGTLRADTTDDKAADDLRQMVNGGLAAARFMTGNDPKIESLINSLRVSGTGKTVGVSFTVTPEMIDVLMGLAQGGNPIGK
jgi:hypothetical protein